MTPSDAADAAAAAQATLDVVAGIAIPSAAIIISTLVAVSLARWERKAAEKARREEREEVAAARSEERNLALAARLDDRTEEAFVRTLVALATLNTINVNAESLSEPFRELRVGLTLLVTATRGDASLIADWFESERMAGLAQAETTMGRVREALSTMDESNRDVKLIWAGEPINTWARDFANALRVWRRGEAAEADLVAWTANARKVAFS